MRKLLIWSFVGILVSVLVFLVGSGTALSVFGQITIIWVSLLLGFFLLKAYFLSVGKEGDEGRVISWKLKMIYIFLSVGLMSFHVGVAIESVATVANKVIISLVGGMLFHELSQTGSG